MFFRNFVMGILLFFGIPSSLHAVVMCQQTETVACDEVAVKSFIETTGKTATDTLVMSIDKLVGDRSNPKSYGVAIDTINKELIRMLTGTMTILGLTVVKDEVIGLNVKKAVKELIEGTAIGTGATKGATKLGKSMLIGIIVDIAKDVVQRVVYTTLKNEGYSTFKSGALAGAAVSLVEQSAIYATNGGNAYAIILAESELLFTRIYQIGTLAYEFDTIQNDTEANMLLSDFIALEQAYTPIFCKGNDMFPSVAMINEINTKVDVLVQQYTETDFTARGTTFKNKIAHRLYYFKLLYRHERIENYRKNKDKDEYVKYVNKYFSPSEGWFLKARYGATVPLYSDVDVDSKVHKDIYKLANRFNIKYITTGDTLSPNEYVGGKELTAWLDILLKYVEKQDKKDYDESKYALLSGVNYQVNLDIVTYSQIMRAFYKEIYGISDSGNSYVVCFSNVKRRSNVSSLINQKLVELNEVGIDKSYARLSLKSFYDTFPRSLTKLKILSATHLVQESVKRKDLIRFGVRFLTEHRLNKRMMIRCKD